jgi:predicted metal-dependent hydrolase
MKLLIFADDPALFGIVKAYALAAQPQVELNLVPTEVTSARAPVRLAAQAQPNLILVELTETTKFWLPVLRADPATRRLRCICLGETRYNDQANQLKLPFYEKTYLQAHLASIVASHAARETNPDTLADICSQPPPDLVLEGLRQFNKGDYYEAHETLEAAWMAETDPVRDLYRVILQVAVAYYQILRGNFAGAEKLFLRTLQWFARLPNRCQGIDVEALRLNAEQAYAHLLALGEANIAQYDRALLRPVHCDYL